MYRVFSILVVAISLFALGGCEQEPSIRPSGKVIKVGFIGPFTGPESTQGRESIKGIRIAMHVQPLLHNGDAIEMIVENDHGDPELTERALRKLVQEDDVTAVFLASASNTVLAVAPTVDSLEIPAIALAATHPDIAKQGRFMSQLCFDDHFQGSVAALFVADELLIEHATVFTDTGNLHSSFLADEFVRKFESVDGVVSDIIQVNTGQPDYVELMKNSMEKGSRLLYMPVTDKYLMEIILAVRELGWAVDLMGADGLAASMLHDHPDFLSELDGIYVTDFFSKADRIHSRTVFGRKMAKTFRSLFAGYPSSYTGLGAEGYGILYEAMNKCSDPANRECVNSMIRTTNGFVGVAGKISIGADGKAARPLLISRIKDRELKTVVKVH